APGSILASKPECEAEVPVDDLLAVEQCDQRAERQERSERDRQLRVALLEHHVHTTNDGADQRAEHDGNQHTLPAEKGAYHREQLDVTATHSFMPAQPLVERSHQPQTATAEQHTDEAIAQARSDADCRQYESNDDAWQTDPIGDDLMIQIDEGDRNQ